MFSNELIKFQDDSGALPSRFITWRMKQTFWGREDVKLTDKLLAERPGILNLALEALDRLRVRDGFIQPASGKEMSDDLGHLASNMACFVDDCCAVGPEQEWFIGDAYKTWQDWCREKGVRYGWEEEQFSAKLVAQVPTITRSRPRGGGKGRPTLLIGIGLRGFC